MGARILKGDQVLVLRGDEKGKKGKVLKIFPDQQTALVEGVNFQSKHTRPTQRRKQGGILKKEGPLHLSKLLLICPKCGEATRVGSDPNPPKTDEEKTGGKRRKSRARICRKCGEMI
ncbi:50S ribosomal protein L24 [candidate division TA06 bacterium]|nr:50S ribosomal protein L24 [candidate division TA06 bacterium]